MPRILIAFAALLLSLPTAAAPVADDERVPIDLRRTTLIVRNIERSLSFYRDALGMKVIYDNKIRTPRSAATDEEAQRVSRLVFLRANDDYIGVIGLMQYLKPERRAANQGLEPFTPGSSVLLFNSKNLSDTFDKASKVLGTRVLFEPTRREYPSYDGKGTIPVMVSVITDPDGFIIELNQLLVDNLQ